MEDFLIEKEYSAGGIVRKKLANEYLVMLIRIKKEGLEIPKGHVEGNETFEETAKREIKEETQLISELKLIKKLEKVTHKFQKDNKIIEKETQYFLFETIDNETLFDKKPKDTREIVWLNETSPRLAEIKYPNLKKIIESCFL